MEKPLQDGKYELKKDSLLEAVENILGEMCLERIEETNKEIIIHDGQEIFIPSVFQKELLEELHSTHLSGAAMQRIARQKFWWPGMAKDIEERYQVCKQCKDEAISKIQKKDGDKAPLF